MKTNHPIVTVVTIVPDREIEIIERKKIEIVVELEERKRDVATTTIDERVRDHPKKDRTIARDDLDPDRQRNTEQTLVRCTSQRDASHQRELNQIVAKHLARHLDVDVTTTLRPRCLIVDTDLCPKIEIETANRLEKIKIVVERNPRRRRPLLHLTRLVVVTVTTRAQTAILALRVIRLVVVMTLHRLAHHQILRQTLQRRLSSLLRKRRSIVNILTKIAVKLTILDLT